MLTRWESDVSITLKATESERKTPSSETTHSWKCIKNQRFFNVLADSEAAYTNGRGTKNVSAEIANHDAHTTKKGQV